MDVFQLKKVVDIINKHGTMKRNGYRFSSVVKQISHNGNKYELYQEVIMKFNNQDQQPREMIMQNLVIRYNLLSVYEKISWELLPKQEQPPQHKINHPKLAIKAIYSLIRKYA